MNHRVINFTQEELDTEYFSDIEYDEMFKAFEENESFGAGALIADKTCTYLKFDNEQKKRWRGKMIEAISESQLPKVISFSKKEDAKFILKNAFLSSVQNFAESEKQYQDSLNTRPEEEKK